MNFIQMSISASTMVIAVTIVRALAINHLPKKTFLILWGIGTLLCSLYFAISYIRCRRKFASSVSVENDFTTLIAGTLTARNGSIKLTPDKIGGDVQVTSELGFIKATLSQDFSFTIYATSKMGDVINKFSDGWMEIEVIAK